MMKLLFPSHPLKPRLPDPGFQDEFDAAIRAGFTCELYSLEDLGLVTPDWQRSGARHLQVMLRLFSFVGG